jgi:3-hydroxyacyl-CoA dehydrogenase/enoyl-CoA hydratase/3-hydroxybutyryl-CoA epimerase
VSSKPSEYEHWSVAIDQGRVAWLTLDRAESSSNTLSRSVLLELDQILNTLEAEKNLTGVVFRSGKDTGFIMGADVSEFGQLNTTEEAVQAAGLGQTILRRISALPCPSVAAINGYALGGGLELALQCTYRVAAFGYERTLGLPEVQLGIHPGFGGSVRMIELVGPIAGLDLMLTGRNLSPIEAQAIGLVDAIIDIASLESEAVRILRARPKTRRAAWYLRILNAIPLRKLIAGRTRARVAKRANPRHYPAPFAIVELWRKYGGRGSRAYGAEVDSIGKLLVTPTCKQLVRVFQLRERLRNLAPKSNDATAVHLVGAGIMGGDIAAWCALRGLSVSMQDREEKYVLPAIARAQKFFKRRLKAPGAADAALGRLTVDIEGARVSAAHVVVEAIAENLEVKQQVFAKLEQNAPPDAILASNTSSIRIEEIASGLKNPSRLVGIHFFNPVAQLPLVEVISGPETSNDVTQRAIAFVTQIGKVPLPCKSAPGFVVNRVLMPYMLEALHAHSDGVPFESIDAAATNFGMPMGPIELADRVGLDVASHVADNLAEAFGRNPPAILKTKVQAGQLGIKSKSGGFYRYVDGRAQKSELSSQVYPDLEDRLILALVNESIACLTDGVIEDPDLLDAGVIFGTGFAPFTGGPISYARQRGFAKVTGRLAELAQRYGPRFEPHHGWKKFLPSP